MRKHFQRDYETDSVSVDFILEIDGSFPPVTGIQLNTSKGLLDLPKNPTLERIDEIWCLCENKNQNINNVDTYIRTPKINQYTNDIVKTILKIQEEEISKSN